MQHTNLDPLKAGQTSSIKIIRLGVLGLPCGQPRVRRCLRFDSVWSERRKLVR